MRITFPRLLIVIAFLVVILVELRTALGFFDVVLTVPETVGLGALAIGLLVLWALWPNDD